MWDGFDHLEHMYTSESTRSARTRRHVSAVMTQVVSPHVGGTAAIVSCEGCQILHPSGNIERLVELDISIVLDEQQVNALSADAQR